MFDYPKVMRVSKINKIQLSVYQLGATCEVGDFWTTHLGGLESFISFWDAYLFRCKENQPRKANDFIGFASYAFDSSNEIRTIEKNENTAVIYGKKAVYFEGHGKFLQWIRHSF